jgi:hypothetical protein
MSAPPGATVHTISIDGYLGRARPSAVPETGRSWPADRKLTARYDWFRYMRAEYPVACDPDTGVWGMFRYADVHSATSRGCCRRW